MALLQKFSSPDGLLEIIERIYVFNCCFRTEAWEQEDYKVYVGNIISQFKDNFPESSIMISNFREGDTASRIASVLSEYDITVMDYPQHYGGCPLFSLEMINHFLKSSDKWLSLGHQYVLIMHSEVGGWPVLAFVIAALLLYRKHCTGEFKTLDMVHNHALSDIIPAMSPLNPVPSQLRYLQYVSRSTAEIEWPAPAPAPAPPSPPAPPPPPPASKGGTLSRTAAVKSHPAKKLKHLHWLKLNTAPQGSLWAEAQESGEAASALEIDMSELQHLFSAAKRDSDKAKEKSRAANKPEKVQLIEHSRAYNCEIMLSKVKTPLPELMDYVLALDDSAMDVDQVDNLIEFCPTSEEMELIKDYKGELDKLCKREQFFLELMRVPRSEAKLRVFSYKLHFSTKVSDLRKSLNNVYLSVEQIRSSVKLRRVMQTILSLGNALNEGTARGAAVGFRLDSLLKLNETRCRKNKMTLMHYLCKVLADKLPELLDFSKELDSLELASKIQLKILAAEMIAITKGLEKVAREKKLCKKDGHVSKRFRKSLKKFLASAEGEVKSLASLYVKMGRSVDALILYFGEDRDRCSYEQVVSTLLLFVRMFNQAHEENCKKIEAEKKKAHKEGEQERKEAEHERLELQKEAEKENGEAENEIKETTGGKVGPPPTKKYKILECLGCLDFMFELIL